MLRAVQELGPRACRTQTERHLVTLDDAAQVDLHQRVHQRRPRRPQLLEVGHLDVLEVAVLGPEPALPGQELHELLGEDVALDHWSTSSNQ